MKSKRKANQKPSLDKARASSPVAPTGVPLSEAHKRAARRITGVLFSAQALSSAGFIAAATVASIVGADLSGRAAFAGVPSSAYMLGSAFSAYLWGMLMDRLGRRGSLSLGLLCGVVGASFASFAVTQRSFGLLLVGLVLMGTAQAAVQLGRFMAAEVNPPEARGRAVANVVLGSTFGAVVGPLTVGPVGTFARGFGLPELSGPYMISAMMFVLAGVAVFSLLKPDPKTLALELARAYPQTKAQEGRNRPLKVILREPPVVVAMTAMVVGQMVMVMLMVITALHMTHHHHSLGNVSFVISSHTFGMFAFSVLSGRLSDRFGRLPVISFGAAILLLSCVLAPLSPHLVPLAVALFLLGLGWNFCFVGGSSYLADQLSPLERARTQGFNDLLVGLSAAAGSLGSGIVFASVGFAMMGLVGGLLSLLPLVAALWLWRGQKGVLVRAK